MSIEILRLVETPEYIICHPQDYKHKEEVESKTGLKVKICHWVLQGKMYAVKNTSIGEEKSLLFEVSMLTSPSTGEHTIHRFYSDGSNTTTKEIRVSGFIYFPI